MILAITIGVLLWVASAVFSRTGGYKKVSPETGFVIAATSVLVRAATIFFMLIAVAMAVF